VLEDRERTAGPDHPDTIAARANLAFAYRSAGQLQPRGGDADLNQEPRPRAYQELRSDHALISI
jgi:hypothetical protein